jgi:hypothetical protein
MNHSPGLPLEAVKAVAKTIPVPEGKEVNLRRLKLSLESIKRANALMKIDLKHLDERDLWDSILKTTQKLRKYVTRADRRATHKLVFGSLEVHMNELEKLEATARFRLNFFGSLARARKGGRSPSQEYVYQRLLSLWIDYGGKPAKTKGGPLFDFLDAGCKALEVKSPGLNSIPAIVVRHSRVA